MLLDEMFYDEVAYEKQGAVNSFGTPSYEVPVQIKCRKVKNKLTYVIKDEKTDVVLERVYHIPKDIDIKENDKLDGHIVKAILPCRDIFGALYYWKVWVL